ncbi:hypothetical protein RF11_11993 [Thelohanellus kitauei]|uniref:Uncharacterized protein n=1 Tax=Thelohanellus kitauei TaxID=669202 RepID=A0A0C2MPA6_THEKT|nr:hypothetical protein RF11_11993 [Thelohanellus kitauei]
MLAPKHHTSLIRCLCIIIVSILLINALFFSYLAMIFYDVHHLVLPGYSMNIGKIMFAFNALFIIFHIVELIVIARRTKTRYLLYNTHYFITAVFCFVLWFTAFSNIKQTRKILSAPNVIIRPHALLFAMPIINQIQHRHQCCGINGIIDYPINQLPRSCCKDQLSECSSEGHNQPFERAAPLNFSNNFHFVHIPGLSSKIIHRDFQSHPP